MAHFARLDDNKKVLSVSVIRNEDCLDEDGNESEQAGITFLKKIHGEDTNWKQTSYNGNFRVRYASVNYTYSEQYDAFIPPKPYESWTLDTNTYDWVSPVPKPEDYCLSHQWNEETQSWILVE